MSIVVEDGTGKTDANSFASVGYADTYFGDRQIDAWTSLTSPVKEAALIKATDYITVWFSSQFKGVQTLNQSRSSGIHSGCRCKAARCRSTGFCP